MSFNDTEKFFFQYKYADNTSAIGYLAKAMKLFKYLRITSVIHFLCFSNDAHTYPTNTERKASLHMLSPVALGLGFILYSSSKMVPYERYTHQDCKIENEARVTVK